MSRKKEPTSDDTDYPGLKKAQRYIQPSILLALKGKPTYGYELISEISKFGFVAGPAPPGMIYRHLRELEENALVSSEWETGGTGAAKRVYQLTMEGNEVLKFWIEHMGEQANKLLAFIEIYKKSGG
jgi:poly-beta-hydroxybutyrate-responsive repressor